MHETNPYYEHPCPPSLQCEKLSYSFTINVKRHVRENEKSQSLVTTLDNGEPTSNKREEPSPNIDVNHSRSGATKILKRQIPMTVVDNANDDQYFRHTNIILPGKYSLISKDKWDPSRNKICICDVQITETANPLPCEIFIVVSVEHTNSDVPTPIVFRRPMPANHNGAYSYSRNYQELGEIQIVNYAGREHIVDRIRGEKRIPNGPQDKMKIQSMPSSSSSSSSHSYYSPSSSSSPTSSSRATQSGASKKSSIDVAKGNLAERLKRVKTKDLIENFRDHGGIAFCQNSYMHYIFKSARNDLEYNYNSDGALNYDFDTYRVDKHSDDLVCMDSDSVDVVCKEMREHYLSKLIYMTIGKCTISIEVDPKDYADIYNYQMKVNEGNPVSVNVNAIVRFITVSSNPDDYKRDLPVKIGVPNGASL